MSAKTLKLLQKPALTLGDCSLLKSPSTCSGVATPRSPFVPTQPSSTPLSSGLKPSLNEAFCRTPVAIRSFLSICTPDAANRVPTPPPWVFNPRLNQPKFVWPHGPIASPRTRALINGKSVGNEEPIKMGMEKSETFPMGLPMSASTDANDSFCCSPLVFRFEEDNIHVSDKVSG